MERKEDNVKYYLIKSMHCAVGLFCASGFDIEKVVAVFDAALMMNYGRRMKNCKPIDDED